MNEKQVINWTTRLKRCLNDMPEGIEVLFTYNGRVIIFEEGSMKAYNEGFGDADYNHVDGEITCFTPKPSVASRMDGRDSQI